jgi:hypothetical protein
VSESAAVVSTSNMSIVTGAVGRPIVVSTTTKIRALSTRVTALSTLAFGWRKVLGSVSKRITSRTSAVSPCAIIVKSRDVPNSGYPVSAESRVTTPTSVVSRSAALWSPHRSGQPSDPVTSSVQAAAPSSRSAPSTPRNKRSGKRYTPSVVTRRRHHWRLSDVGVNACGNRSDMSHRASAPPRVTLSTGRAGANSNNTCRQIPHGGVGTSASVAITRASNSLSPRATAAPTATRSAHEPAGYDAFSTLHPSTTIPFEVSRAAPTRKPE